MTLSPRRPGPLQERTRHMSGRTRILVADAHEVVRRGVAALVQADPSLSVCGEASDGNAAVEVALSTKPDVVVMDATQAAMGGADTIRTVRRRLPNTQVLVLAASDVAIADSVSAGAISYVLKSVDGAATLKAIKAAARGERCLALPAAPRPPPPQQDGPWPASPLTDRERQVALLLVEGKNAHAIGAMLGISSKTADVHRANIMRKLEIRSVSELVRYAIRHKFIRP